MIDGFNPNSHPRTVLLVSHTHTHTSKQRSLSRFRSLDSTDVGLCVCEGKSGHPPCCFHTLLLLAVEEWKFRHQIFHPIFRHQGESFNASTSGLKRGKVRENLASFSSRQILLPDQNTTRTHQHTYTHTRTQAHLLTRPTQNRLSIVLVQYRFSNLITNGNRSRPTFQHVRILSVFRFRYTNFYSPLPSNITSPATTTRCSMPCHHTHTHT